MVQGFEKRAHVRHPLTGDLTGAIRSAASNSVIPCIAVDASKSGMKVVLSLDLSPGTELVLAMSGGEHRLLVMWCAKEPSRKGYFACGLKACDPSVDLLQYFRVLGWLDNEPSVREDAGPAAPAPGT